MNRDQFVDDLKAAKRALDGDYSGDPQFDAKAGKPLALASSTLESIAAYFGDPTDGADEEIAGLIREIGHHREFMKAQ